MFVVCVVGGYLLCLYSTKAFALFTRLSLLSACLFVAFVRRCIMAWYKITHPKTYNQSEGDAAAAGDTGSPSSAAAPTAAPAASSGDSGGGAGAGAGGNPAAARARARATAAAAARAATTPAWMSEMMGLEEETGLTCMVCHEGYKCKVRHGPTRHTVVYPASTVLDWHCVHMDVVLWFPDTVHSSSVVRRIEYPSELYVAACMIRSMKDAGVGGDQVNPSRCSRCRVR